MTSELEAEANAMRIKSIIGDDDGATVEVERKAPPTRERAMQHLYELTHPDYIDPMSVAQPLVDKGQEIHSYIASLEAENKQLKSSLESAVNAHQVCKDTLEAENARLKADVERKDGLLKQLKTNSICSEHQLLIINEALSPAAQEVK